MKKYEIKSEEHKRAMLELGEAQREKHDLMYKKFESIVVIMSVFCIVLTGVLSFLFYKYIISSGTPKYETDKLATEIAATIVFAIVTFLFVTYVIVKPIARLLRRIFTRVAYKKHHEETQTLDGKIESLVNRIMKDYGGEKDEVLKISSKMYSDVLAEREKEAAKERSSYGSYSSSYTASNCDDVDSEHSSGASSESCDSRSSSQTFVDDRGRDVAYRDGDRVYSSDTHDLVGYMSGNQLHDYDGNTLGEFDNDGNFTKYK